MAAKKGRRSQASRNVAANAAAGVETAPASTDVPATVALSAPVTAPQFEVTFRGTEAAVRSALHDIRFASPWDIATARGIALDQTLISDADLDDTLDGNKIRMYAQTDRDLYQERCCKAAATLGHSIPAAKQSQIKVNAGTPIREVAKALYENAD